MRSEHHPSRPGRAASHDPYAQLLVMTALAFLSMYLLMYAMTNAAANVLANLNQVYMAALMTAPMVIIELSVMRGMYRNRRLNAALLAAGALGLFVFFGLIRRQVAISDPQFLRSMIPHHAAAILMCERAPIHDSDIDALCRRIISSQQAEIDQMKRKLSELEAR